VSPKTEESDVPARSAVVDLGSNSVRLVVYDGVLRNPVVLFNEKAVLRLGRGLQTTGRLNEDGVVQALMVLRRYDMVAHAMGAAPMQILATAAVRDASNGLAFADKLRTMMPAAELQVLSGAEEASLSADGVLCGIPDADGILADIGGGSLELVRLSSGAQCEAATMPLGLLRLSDRANGDMERARVIAETELAGVRWLPDGAGRDLYLVGGAWRALARIHMAQTNYPLSIIHHYTISRDDARELAGMLATSGRRVLERLPGVPRRRIDDLPFAAVVLRRLLRATDARRVVFSASGMREGWYAHHLPAALLAEDPLSAAARDIARRHSRDPSLPPALVAWTAPLFACLASLLHLREAACWLSDIGCRDHPEFRAEQAFLRVLRYPGIGLDHQARAFLALTVALRYEAEPGAAFLHPACLLLDVESAHTAEVLGVALRLAYTLSAGTRALLAGTSLEIVGGNRLVLRLRSNAGVFAGEAVIRRLDRLAQALNLEAGTEIAADLAA